MRVFRDLGRVASQIKPFEAIRANKEVQKSINVIMVVNGNNPHDFYN